MIRPNVKVLSGEAMTKRRLDAHWNWQEGRRFTPKDDQFMIEVISWLFVVFLLSLSVWWVGR